jgi:hypothetical protein
MLYGGADLVTVNSWGEENDQIAPFLVATVCLLWHGFIIDSRRTLRFIFMMILYMGL